MHKACSKSSQRRQTHRKIHLEKHTLGKCGPGRGSEIRKCPNEQRVQYGANPARDGTPRFRRYENYKDATTIGGAKRLVATN